MVEVNTRPVVVDCNDEVNDHRLDKKFDNH